MSAVQADRQTGENLDPGRREDWQRRDWDVRWLFIYLPTYLCMPWGFLAGGFGRRRLLSVGCEGWDGMRAICSKTTSLLAVGRELAPPARPPAFTSSPPALREVLLLFIATNLPYLSILSFSFLPFTHTYLPNIIYLGSLTARE